MKVAATMLAIGLTLGGGIASAADERAGLYHKSWTKKDGAPGIAHSMAQDRRGLLWFTSNSGLYHFDGARFQQTDSIDGNKLLSATTNLVATIDDTLWVGYTFGGLSAFGRGTVQHFGSADGLPARTMFDLKRTRDGVLWVSSSAGVFWRDGERWRQVNPSAGLPKGMVRYFTLLPDGTLLVYHRDGVYRSVNGTRRFEIAVAQPGIETGFLRHDGRVLMVTSQHKMHLFDPVSGRVSPIVLPKGSGTPTNVTLDSDDNIWLSTERGMEQLGSDLRSRRTFTGKNQFSGQVIFTELKDREGNLWFTTENGVDYIRAARLHDLTLPANMRGALSVVVGREGNVWIGNSPTTGNYDDTSIVIASDGKRILSRIRDVNATLREHDGSLWFAGRGGLWHQQGLIAQRWQLPATFKGAVVQAIAKGLDGRLWVSVVGHGVGTLDAGGWHAGGGHAELADSAAVSLHVDGQGRVWFGYPSNRIAMLENGVVRRFGSMDGIAVGNVLVMSSQAGRLWIGGSEGLARMQGQRFYSLAASDGNRLYGVSGLVETNAGELWLHETDGLVRIGAVDLAEAIRTNAFTVGLERFDYLDGYEGSPSAIRPLNSLSEAPDGKLWYATTGSVGWIDPANVMRNSLAPTPQLMGLLANHQSVSLRDIITLPAHTKNLQIDFTAAALSIPERVRFRYRLIGLESAWLEAGGRRQAFYTNLGPGRYTFEVMAANEDGVWNKVPATLKFRIDPSPTQTLWFKLACAATAVGVMYLLYLARLRQLTVHVADRMRERLLERERIARTLHDTFLQSVQALILRFDAIKNALPPEAPALLQIDAALDAAQNLVDEGRDQVMDLRASEKHAVKLSDELRAAGEALAELHEFDFIFEVVGVEHQLRQEVSSEVVAIGKEALLNAARHSGSAVVTVEVAYSSKYFRLTIGDYGRGLDENVRKSDTRPRHWGMTGMQERAKGINAALTIGSPAGLGVVIELTLTSVHAYEK